jgi:uncharacterized protein YjbI with pentapeptide repeats
MAPLPFTVFNTVSEITEYVKARLSKKETPISFEYSIFHCEVDFNEIIGEFESNISFSFSRFYLPVSFDNVKFLNSTTFYDCEFENTASFEYATFNGQVKFGSFLKDVSFRGATFNAAVTFYDNIGGVSYFSDCKFYDTVYFDDLVFEKETFFDDTIFYNIVDFDRVTFNGKLNAWNIKFESNVSFLWANFREKVNLSEMTVKGSANFYGVNFVDNAYFYNSTISQLELQKSVIEKGLFFLGSKIEYSNRETYRIIKHEFLKYNNKIEALNYHAKEMEAFRIELKENNNYNKLEKYLLLINKFSNGYGLNPWLGAGVTIIVSILFFIFYWLTLDYKPVHFTCSTTIAITFNCIGSVLSYFAEFFSPIHMIRYMDSYRGSWSIFIDIVSRIFIGFCIFQTIQAFRKYGRF